MARVPLGPWRSVRVERVDGKVRIVTAPKRTSLYWLVFIAALLAWAYGGVSAARDVLDPAQAARRGWVAVWLLVWMG